MTKRVEVVRLPPETDDRAVEQAQRILETACLRALLQQLQQQNQQGAQER